MPTAAAHGGASSADGEVYVAGFECLGACDIAPMASIDERYYGPLDSDDARTAVEQLRAGAEIVPERALASRPTAAARAGPDPRVSRVGRKRLPPRRWKGESESA